MLTPWKKRLIVLGLWAPLGLYVAHMVAEMSDRPAPPLPTSKLPDGGIATKLRADAKTRAVEARAELQAAAGFDLSTTKGSFHDSLNNRASALANARPFLDPELAQPSFEGAKAKEFEGLYKKEANLRGVEQRIEAWLKNPTPKPAWEDFQKSYIEPYKSAGATPRMIDNYNLRGRHKILTAFADDLGKQYDDTVKNPGLPLAGAKELIGQTKELFEMCKTYQDEASAASGTGEPAGGRLDEEVKTLKAGWIARRALLEEFDVDPARYTPAQAQEWFKKVNAYCGQLKSDTTQTAIRAKTQEFCSTFLPNKLALDEHLVVTVDGNETMEKRSKIKVRYRYLQVPYFRDNDPVLTADPTSLNEYTAEKPEFWPPGAQFSTYTRDSSPVKVKPTPLSEAAEAYCRARQDVMGVGGWTRGTVGGMIAKADNIATPGPGDTHIWNKLSLVGATGEYKVYQRLKIVEKAIEDCRDLFPNR